MLNLGPIWRRKLASFSVYIPIFFNRIIDSYNRLNGIHASENPFLLKTILRDEWKFEGTVRSHPFRSHFETINFAN